MKTLKFTYTGKLKHLLNYTKTNTQAGKFATLSDFKRKKLYNAPFLYNTPTRPIIGLIFLFILMLLSGFTN